MPKLFLISVLLLSITMVVSSCSSTTSPDGLQNELFNLADNDVTITCANASPGDRGDVNGGTYEAVDNELLRTRIEEDADLTMVCTSLVTDMSDLFRSDIQPNSFNQDIGSWDTGNVTTMENMFGGQTAFNQNIGSWNTENVTNFFGMFTGADAFDQNIGNWNTGSATNMSGMFFGADSFNQAIGDWSTGNVTTMSLMFGGASSFNKDIGNWDTGSVTDMEAMFFVAESFNQDLSSWCVESISGKPADFDLGADDWTLPRPNWGAACD